MQDRISRYALNQPRGSTFIGFTYVDVRECVCSLGVFSLKITKLCAIKLSRENIEKLQEGCKI